MDGVMPGEMADRWGGLPFLKYKGNGEWSAACPYCGTEGHNDRSGTPDRFHIHAPDGLRGARGICRRCGAFEWLDGDSSVRHPASFVAMVKYWRDIAFAYEDRLDNFRRVRPWIDFHSAMGPNERSIWLRSGVPDWAIDKLMLGFTDNYSVRNDEGEYEPTSALTIPYFSGTDAMTLQYRIIGKVGQGKYMFTRGLRAPLYLPEPEMTPFGSVLVVEGAKKAIIMQDALEGRVTSVVGLPGKTPSWRVLSELSEADPVYLALDPDAYSDEGQIRKMVCRIGHGRVRIVRYPEKPDDYALRPGMSRESIFAPIRYAKKYGGV